jgi:transposase
MASIGEGGEAEVTIGVDPHLGSHTAVALGVNGEVLGAITVDNGREGWKALRSWACGYPRRRWAVEGAGNHFVRAFVGELLDEGEEVYSIPPSMTAQYRSRRGRKKDDQVDAENAAKALMANPDLSIYEPASYERELKDLARNYLRLSHQLKANRMSSKGASSPMVTQLNRGLIKVLEDALASLKREMEKAVRAVAPELLDLRGVGPIVASMVLAETGRISRFASRDHYAAFAGCAPIRWESGAHHTARVNPGGNRRLNWAAHIIVISRLRFDDATKAYRDRKLAEGKTQRQVIRQLKTYVCRELYKHLRRHHTVSDIA